MGRRVRRRLRGGRVVDFGGGHGLLAQVLLLLDDSSPSAIVVDKALPLSSAAVHDALRRTWPRLAGRVAFVALPMDHVPVETDDVVVSSRLRPLTDRVWTSPPLLERGWRSCRAVRSREGITGDVAGWLDPARHRRDAGPSSGGERLSDLDTDHTRGHHPEEPAVDGRATRTLLAELRSHRSLQKPQGYWPDDPPHSPSRYPLEDAAGKLIGPPRRRLKPPLHDHRKTGIRIVN